MAAPSTTRPYRNLFEQKVTLQGCPLWQPCCSETVLPSALAMSGEGVQWGHCLTLHSSATRCCCAVRGADSMAAWIVDMRDADRRNRTARIGERFIGVGKVHSQAMTPSLPLLARRSSQLGDRPTRSEMPGST